MRGREGGREGGGNVLSYTVDFLVQIPVGQKLVSILAEMSS